MLAAAPGFAGLDRRWLLRAMGASLAGASGLLAPLLALGENPALTWGYLAWVSLTAGIAAVAATRGLRGEPGGTGSSTVVDAPVPAPTFLATLRDGLWEPALGLGLSLMSTLLPWGAFLTGDAASTPAPWTFCVGPLLAGLLCLAAARTRLTRVPLDVAMHVAMPVLAAAVVGLRMLGDVTDTPGLLTAVKGVASGVTAAFFFAFAWFAMAEAAQRRPLNPNAPFAAGLVLAFGSAAVILPLHALNQSVAALAAPALSLAFLVAASCSSLGFERARAHGGQTPQPQADDPQPPATLSVEEAASRLAHERGLSPREEQVLVQLACGRSAQGAAEVLGISPHTVRAHVRRIHEKLAVSSRDEVVDAIEALRRP